MGEGPRWVDGCGGGEDLRFCWRGSWRRRVLDVGDGEGCTEQGDWFTSETWAGKAPCWRHDDFPYITVSEVFDAAAGVRVIARDCFMLETLSVHVRPKLRIQGVKSTPETPHHANPSQSRSSSRSGISSGSGSDNSSHDDEEHAEGPDGQEVQFTDGFWAELMGKGFICGDERWIVGEDRKGDVTILHF
ncbi:hypothetical protein PT974_08915 [Cladobotryum mycophilum]|uniref:Uncharacterized protein n=1 Tax=Cladobotryum mycophilum TaxID=491253 RepID=A0ABR0SFP3_9HYPO